MRIAELRKVIRAQPFRPFTLHLADGREFPIDHPEFFLISRNERTLVVADTDGSVEIVDPPLVTSLTIPDGQARSLDDV